MQLLVLLLLAFFLELPPLLVQLQVQEVSCSTTIRNANYGKGRLQFAVGPSLF
jgi:hypothetical protein